MEFSKVSGKKNNHKVTVYALSTCVWCKLTKQFLNENDVEYEYIDVDLCNEEDKQKMHANHHKQRRKPNLPNNHY